MHAYAYICVDGDMERASICISLHACTTCIPYAYHMHEPPRVYTTYQQRQHNGCEGVAPGTISSCELRPRPWRPSCHPPVLTYLLPYLLILYTHVGRPQQRAHQIHPVTQSPSHALRHTLRGDAHSSAATLLTEHACICICMTYAYA